MGGENTEYGADQIQILEGLEAVRKRPGMYIGSTSSRGLHHLVYEIEDNTVDMILSGKGQVNLVQFALVAICKPIVIPRQLLPDRRCPVQPAQNGGYDPVGQNHP